MLIASQCRVSIEGRLNQQKPWILFMLKAVKDTATFTRERTFAIRALMNETMEKAKEKLPARVYSKELIETIFRQQNPYVRVASPQGSRRSRFRRGVLTADVHY